MEKLRPPEGRIYDMPSSKSTTTLPSNVPHSRAPFCLMLPIRTRKDDEDQVSRQPHLRLRIRQRLRGKLRLGAAGEVSHRTLLGPHRERVVIEQHVV